VIWTISFCFFTSALNLPTMANMHYLCCVFCVCFQDLLDFDAFFRDHADSSIETGIRMLNSMTFAMKDPAAWNALHPDNPMPTGSERAYSFKYKLSMYVKFDCQTLGHMILLSFFFSRDLCNFCVVYKFFGIKFTLCLFLSLSF
jgi:hypothetical protein